MDSGLTATITREFASSLNSRSDKFRIFRTLESCYFIIAITVTLLMFFGSSWIAEKWLNLDNVSPDKVAFCLKVIGIEIGFKFLAHFYTGGLVGLDQQVKANVYQVVWGVVRNGLVLIPVFIYSTLQVFFLWQTIVTVLFVLVIRRDLLFTIAANSKSYFIKPIIEKSVLKKVWQFAGGMMLISVVAAINTQLDKIALSRLLPIEVLGLYTLAFSLSRGLNLLSHPFSKASLPRIIALYTDGRQIEATRVFKKVYYIVAIVIFVFLSVMVVFSQDLIFIWTNDVDLSKRAHIYVPWIAIGTGFLALQGLPFNIAIAHSFTKYNNILGVLSLLVTIPGYWFFTNQYGGVGAAVTFCLVQVIITIVYLYLINMKFLKTSILELYTKAFVVPVFLTFILALISKNYLDLGDSRFLIFVQIATTVIISLILTTLALVPMKEVTKLGIDIRKAIIK